MAVRAAAVHLALSAALLPSGAAIQVQQYREEVPLWLSQTPAPTYSPGTPCPCLAGACFEAFDKDNDGCLSLAECNLQVGLGSNCSLIAWDANQDGCISGTTEWPNIFAITGGSVCPVQTITIPDECLAGYYLHGSPATCQECTQGETRRRRSIECTSCPHNTFDAGDRDDCAASDNTMTSAVVAAGSFDIPMVNCESFIVGDTVTILGPPVDPLCVPSATEDCTQLIHETTVTSKAANTNGCVGTISDAAPGMPKYSEVILRCTTTDGTLLSRKYTGEVCACGNVKCPDTKMCLLGANNTGTCIPAGPYPIIPTPAPTVGAKGDPHLVNLQGEHFDINHAGEFTLIRLPQAPDKLADFSLLASISPEAGKPCTTYITQVEFSGLWLGKKTLQVRSYLSARSNDTKSDFLGARIVEGDGDAPWMPIEMVDESVVLSSQESEYQVSLSKSAWFPKKQRSVEGAPSVAGMFTLELRNKNADEGAKVLIRQDLPEQEHLNLAVRRLSVLGRLDVGGLLGFDEHPEALEYVSAECNHHKATSQYRVESQEEARGYYYTPAWRAGWDKAQHGHKRPSDLNDNEAAASLVTGQNSASSESMMCKCSASNGDSMGVIIEEEDANFLSASASW